MWPLLFQRLVDNSLIVKVRFRTLGWVGLFALGTLAGCGGGGGGSDPVDPAPSASGLMDASGGTLVGSEHVRLDVQAGPLVGPVAITTSREAANALALLDGQAGAVYEIAHHGRAFQKPAVLAYPAVGLPGQSAVETNALHAQPSGAWQVMDPAVDSADGRANLRQDCLS